LTFNGTKLRGEESKSNIHHSEKHQGSSLKAQDTKARRGELIFGAWDFSEF